jgi:histone-lysine N-methyltransferase SETMAR
MGDDPQNEQRCYIKTEWLRGTPAAQVHRQLVDAYGKDALCQRAVYKWYDRFKSGCTSTLDEPRSGRPREVRTDSNIELIRGLLEIDPRWTCEEMADLSGIPSSSIHRILTEDLGLQKVTTRWVPHHLDDSQKRQRVAVAQQLLRRFRREGNEFLQRIVTLDETWACSYEPNLKSQNAEWQPRDSGDSSRPTVLKRSKGAKKMMLIVCYDFFGVILVHRVPEYQNVNQQYYRHFIIHHLRPALCKKRPRTLEQGLLLLHDNASPHKGRMVQELLADYGWEVLPHPPYSPDLSPCDYDLFPKMKNQLRGRRYQCLNELFNEIVRLLKHLGDSGAADGVQKLPERWERAIAFNGSYFESL